MCWETPLGYHPMSLGNCVYLLTNRNSPNIAFEKIGWLLFGSLHLSLIVFKIVAENSLTVTPTSPCLCFKVLCIAKSHRIVAVIPEIGPLQKRRVLSRGCRFVATASSWSSLVVGVMPVMIPVDFFFFNSTSWIHQSCWSPIIFLFSISLFLIAYGWDTLSLVSLSGSCIFGFVT